MQKIPKQRSTVYEMIYKRITPILSALGEDYYVKLEVSGFMDLHINLLEKDPETGAVEISLAHYREQNGDMISDPDMTVRVYMDRQMAEALSYQDTFGYRKVYTQGKHNTWVNTNAKRELNHFLNFWLQNLKSKGFIAKAKEA